MRKVFDLLDVFIKTIVAILEHYQTEKRCFLQVFATIMTIILVNNKGKGHKNTFYRTTKFLYGQRKIHNSGV